MLKVDLTTKGDLLAEQLVRQYFVSGVPTVIFINGSGKEVSELRVLGLRPCRSIPEQNGPCYENTESGS